MSEDLGLDVFSFPYVEVEEYRKETVSRYRGNPYIEALPQMPKAEELAKALTNKPDFDLSERELPAEQRIGCLDQLLTIFVVLPRHVRVALAIFGLMRTGYCGRKPFSKEDNSRLQVLYKLQMSGSFHSLKVATLAAQHSMALIGASGCGKSYFLRHMAGMFPPVLRHPNGKWQLPFINIEMAYDGESVHTLASELFKELDRLLPDANYTELFMEKKRFNAQVRLAKALSLAYEHGAGLIIVDEQQNQRYLGNDQEKRVRNPQAAVNLPRNETPLTKLLITASNTSNIPLVMAGTLEMQNLLGSRFTRARRISGRGSEVWRPLEPTFSLEKGKTGDFELMLKGLWRYQWIRKPCPLDDNWLKQFYDLTQGVPDIMVKLFQSSQQAAIISGREELTPALVQAVYDREFVPASFGLKALAMDDPVMQAVVTDLFHPKLSKPRKKSATAAPTPKVLPAPAVKTKSKRTSPEAIELQIDSSTGDSLRESVIAGVNPIGVGRKS